jgi:hypothetical protein
MGIDDSGSVNIATNDAVLPNNWNECGPNAGVYMECRCHGRRQAGEFRIYRYMTSEVSGGLCKSQAVKRVYCGLTSIAPVDDWVDHP